ncbi:MAG: cyanophycin synthetase [Gammaproteobacteria bacterium]|jgi:folylpolyglutamate synthase/dihydropteroate synthase
MDIPHIESTQLTIDDCRRLTGPSLVWDKTGATLDVLIEGRDMNQLLTCWYLKINDLLTAVNWRSPELTHRRYENGFNLLLAAPIDQLNSATLTLETAWYFCCCDLLEKPVENHAPLVQAVRDSMLSELFSASTELQLAAKEQGVDFLIDDELISVGHGEGSIQWSVDGLPTPDQVNWMAVHDIPVALVTGTNGKSTSVRILDEIARAAGRVSGVTSTDFVRVGDDVLDRGDYSGPAGARLLLRDKRLQVAFLEVARGGILRRGLPLRRAMAALITNVSSDHLGEYGVNTLEALIETKFAVRQTLTDDAVLVVNADDGGIVDYISRHPRNNVCWFSLNKNNSKIQQQLDSNGPCSFADDGQLFYFDGQTISLICNIDSIPMTMGGAALHNVRNALGATGVSMAMGFSIDNIRQGLAEFQSDASDNPGRLNSFVLNNGARVIVDFAHNAHSVQAVVDTVKRLPANNRWVMCGSAGDRSDFDIRAIAQGVCLMQPDHVVIVEVEAYLRGRALGEVSDIMKQTCLDSGLNENQIHFAESPLAGVSIILSGISTQDLGLLLVLDERDEVIDLINRS